MAQLDPFEKLSLLSQQMVLEPGDEAAAARNPNAPAPCGHSPAELQRIYGADANPEQTAVSLSQHKKNALGIHHAVVPGGQRVTLLKTMLTSACERDCNYCPFRARRNFRRATFKPEEMADAFAKIHAANHAQGLFLSSGIAGGGIKTQDRLLDTADILRRKHSFHGYLHLKLMPGSQREQVLRAMQLADRVSINLEGPNQKRLSVLAPHKIFFEELLQPLQWAAEIRRTWPPPRRGKWASFVTQFVVGAAGESDVELLNTTAELTKLGLQRSYFSAFHPVHETPLENQPAENPWREHRLYQASFLLRDYGFEFEDLPFSPQGNLPLSSDPKLAWARAHLLGHPVEVNTADRRELLKVPGIGPKGVAAILAARRERKITDVKALQKMGVLVGRALPFILLHGKTHAQQLQLL
jgi:predicted DNA-binding helix-hairpin-helix protein